MNLHFEYAAERERSRAEQSSMKLILMICTTGAQFQEDCGYNKRELQL
jgi:hypothetical protein